MPSNRAARVIYAAGFVRAATVSLVGVTLAIHLVLDGGHAIGALAATIPTIIMRATSTGPELAHRLTYIMCAAAMLMSVVPYLSLPPQIEMSGPSNSPLARTPIDARRIVRACGPSRTISLHNVALGPVLARSKRWRQQTGRSDPGADLGSGRHTNGPRLLRTDGRSAFAAMRLEA